MQHLNYKKGLQKRLQHWFEGDISSISEDGLSDLLTYFLKNNQPHEVQKGLRLIAKRDFPQKGSMASTVPLLERLVASRTREQDFQIPIFIFSTSRSGSIYIRNSLMKSFGYVELRGFLGRSDKQTEIGFHDFGGDTAALNGFSGFISNVHLLPTTKNLQIVSGLSKRAHMIFLFRHPLASLSSFFYRITHRPRKNDNRDMTMLNEVKKNNLLENIIRDNLLDYTTFYEGWYKIISENHQFFTTICYEYFEEDLDAAVKEIVNRIGLDSNRILYAEKNTITNYQRDVRPEYMSFLPSYSFDLYRRPIEFFQYLQKLSIERPT